MNDAEDYFVEAAALTAAAVVKYPFHFTMKFWLALWSTP